MLNFNCAHAQVKPVHLGLKIGKMSSAKKKQLERERKGRPRKEQQQEEEEEEDDDEEEESAISVQVTLRTPIFRKDKEDGFYAPIHDKSLYKLNKSLYLSSTTRRTVRSWGTTIVHRLPAKHVDYRDLYDTKEGEVYVLTSKVPELWSQLRSDNFEGEMRRAAKRKPPEL